jgi:membrane dipeptidase
MNALAQILRASGTRAFGAVFLVLFGTLLFAPSLRAGPVLVPVIDLHVDLPYRSLYKGKGFSTGSGQFTSDQLLQGGVRGVVLPMFVPTDAPSGQSRQEFERSYSHVFRSLLSTPPYSLPGCAVRRAGSEVRQISTWLAFEGAAAVGADEVALRKWSLRGVRSFGLVHTDDNSLSGSSGKGPYFRRNAGGLSEEGKRFVELVAEVGGLVDVSHASDEATEDVLVISERLKRPVLATHSNARALSPHPRNLTDDHIRRIARTGGIVGVNFHQPFLRTSPGVGAGLKEVLQQIRYIENVGGIEAVAIGSDFEGGITPVPELYHIGTLPRLSEALRRDGMPEDDIEKVFSRNAYRVLCQSSAPHADVTRRDPGPSEVR